MPTKPTGAAGAAGAALGVRAQLAAALVVGAQPAAAQPKVRGIYDKVPITGGARDTAHMSYGQVHWCNKNASHSRNTCWRAHT